MIPFSWKKTQRRVKQTRSSLNDQDDEELEEEEGPPSTSKRLALEDPQKLRLRLKEEGIQLAVNNKFWSAVRTWDRALGIDSSDTEFTSAIQEMKAQSFIQLHEWPLAIESAHSSLQSGGSNYYPAWQTLGRAHLGTGNLSEALAAFSKALHLCPDDVELFSEDFLWALSLKSQHDLRQNSKSEPDDSTHSSRDLGNTIQ